MNSEYQTPPPPPHPDPQVFIEWPSLANTGGYTVCINHWSVNFGSLLAKMDFLFSENGLFANEINL